MVHVIKQDACKVCSAERFFTLESIEGKYDKIYDIDLFPDGTLMMHVHAKDGGMCSGSIIGHLKSCPYCGRQF